MEYENILYLLLAVSAHKQISLNRSLLTQCLKTAVKLKTDFIREKKSLIILKTYFQ